MSARWNHHGSMRRHQANEPKSRSTTDAATTAPTVWRLNPPLSLEMRTTLQTRARISNIAPNNRLKRGEVKEPVSSEPSGAAARRRPRKTGPGEKKPQPRQDERQAKE